MVNQLLAKMDGVAAIPNVLVIGLTNRPELIDEALMRPGRLEVQVVIARPDADGRRDIARIHTRAMRENGLLSGVSSFLSKNRRFVCGAGFCTEFFTQARSRRTRPRSWTTSRASHTSPSSSRAPKLPAS